MAVGTLTLAKQSSNAAVANSNYQNRFYLFENGALPIDCRVFLSLYGTLRKWNLRSSRLSGRAYR